MKCASSICRPCWRSTARALLPVWLFLGGTLAQGIAARLRQRGEAVAFLGLLDTAAGDAELGGERG